MQNMGNEKIVYTGEILIWNYYFINHCCVKRKIKRTVHSVQQGNRTSSILEIKMNIISVDQRERGVKNAVVIPLPWGYLLFNEIMRTDAVPRVSSRVFTFY